MSSRLAFPIEAVLSLKKSNYDGIVLVWYPGCESPPILKSVLDAALQFDNALITETAVLQIPDLPAQRLIVSPTGEFNPDFDDVRTFGEAAGKGINRALAAGVKCPLLVLPQHKTFVNSQLVTLLGALEALYVPLQLRESIATKSVKVTGLGVFSENDTGELQHLIDVATKLEAGRMAARDIGGSDPERMAAPNVQTYVENLFKGSNVTVQVIDDVAMLGSEYPLFQAVNRCAQHVPRHRGRIIYLTYEPSGGAVEKTLMFVGKGVTYDTGGADIKAGGVMAGMSRDKCGAAAVCGFMEIVNRFQPRHIKVVAAMSMVRNSVGSDSYVADEVITARSGVRVRIGNTDAEGRMCMADVLCRMKELAVKEVNPHLYTIATLTGHAHLAVGDGYSIVLDNGPARQINHAAQLFASSLEIGQPFEVSTIRREDLAFHRGKGEGDDVFQANNKPSTQTNRGHQGPAAFLILASGLYFHGTDSSQPIPYSHLDIAGSCGDLPAEATGAPIIALANTYVLPEFTNSPK